MSYDFDLDEWRMAVRDLSESEREINADSHRAALGIIGEAEDDQ